MEAQLNDPDVAAVLAKQHPASYQGPRLSAWDEHLAELTYQSDLLASLISVVSRALGGKAQTKPRPRPVTAVDEARLDAAREQHKTLVARLTPKR